jgi:hypothetical protein
MRCAECGAIEGLGDCADCRALAEEGRSNAEVLSALRSEVLPLVDFRRPQRVPLFVGIAAAAAAVVFSLVGLYRVPRHTPVRMSEPLKIKMLTPDPNVVIYWLLDSKPIDSKPIESKKKEEKQ